MRLIKKSQLTIDSLLNKLKNGHIISFQASDENISFQEVTDVLKMAEQQLLEIEDDIEKETLLNKISEIRKNMNTQYNEVKEEIQIFNDDFDIDGSKVMTIFAGPNGSGKSTITQLVRHQIGKVIDIDHLMKIHNVDFYGGREKATSIVDSFIEEGVSFSVETTLAGESVFKKIEKAKANDFTIVAYYVNLMDVSMNLKRINERVSKGGHIIPKEDVLRIYYDSISNIKRLASIADKVVLIDNSGERPITVAKFENGKMTYDIHSDYFEWKNKGLKKTQSYKHSLFKKI